MIYLAKLMFLAGISGMALAVTFLSIVKFGLLFASLIGLPSQ
jgi:hypothetical protein